MLRRQTNITAIQSDNDLQPATGRTVIVYTAGGICASGSAIAPGGLTSTVHLYEGHGIQVGDMVMRNIDTAAIAVVSALLSGGAIQVGGSFPTDTGDTIINLGADGGSNGPAFDGSRALVYDRPSLTSPLSQGRVEVDEEGEYGYWHQGDVALWEVILGPDGFPEEIVVDAFVPEVSGEVDVASHATAGIGTEAAPWTGWESSVVEGQQTIFRAGYYSTTTLSIPVTLTNTPSKTVIRGDGSASTFILITSSTGQFRVYGSGTPTPRVLDGVRVTGLTINAGANNTSSGLFSFENGDIGCYVDDVRVDPLTANVAVGFQFLNCENMHIGMLAVRGRVVTLGAAGHVETGVKFYTDDGNQRGNIQTKQLHITDITTGLKISTSGGSLDNLHFGLVKVVNPSVKDGTLGVDLDSNAEQISFGDLHMEALANGLDANNVENLVVENGLASQIHNEANSAGAAFTITDGNGGRIFSRISTVYNGLVLAGTTTRYNVQASATGAVTGTYFSDTSSGSNFYLVGNIVTSAMTVSGRFQSKGGFSIGTRAAAGLIASGVLTLPALTTNNWTVDTEAAGASDDLDTITGGTDGDIIMLSAVNDARTVVVKNATGNIKCGADRSLDNSLDIITLQKVGSNWLQIAFSDNGA